MAFRKTLAQRLFNITKVSNQTVANCRVSSSSIRTRVPPDPDKPAIGLDPGDKGIFRRFLHKGAAFQPELQPLPIGENLLEKLKCMGIARDRIRLDGLSPPPANVPVERPEVTVDHARKLLRVAQLEAVKTRLREIQQSWISYPDFVRVCSEGCSDPDQGLGLAKMLDESGTVIVLGNNVLLRPEQVAKVLQTLIPMPGGNPNDPRLKELEEMEKQKAEINKKADILVRRELWGGLGFLVLQTAGFMRLTFWELSWDVMEPICFYLTSMYCMAGYTFFLRTSREPSFEGFYRSRFQSKQKRLMKINNFDIAKYDVLQRACYPNSVFSEQAATSTSPIGKVHFGPIIH
ncbi:calcium uniporter protein 2, mitochondrial [Quercus suber]|nr:calcium uniporter protein 2, mitochondrial-like [Quercus suber]POF11651.1 calcium uniporter protein 2, mitochondrial [Quercus suber]